MPELVGPQFDAFEALTVSTAAVGFTAATRGSDRPHVHVFVEGGAVRYRTDGTDPTASVGTPLEVGAQLKLNSAHDLANVRFIRRDGVDATLNSHFGRG
jgi:hypothetical protein